MSARRLLPAVAFWVAGSVAAQVASRPSELPPWQQTPGWERLFDGSSLRGWRGDTARWRVVDGAITAAITTEQPLRENVYLASEAAPARDLELRFLFKVVGGNSGVQYRSTLPPTGEPQGYQADLEAGPSHTGIVYENAGAGILAKRGESVTLSGDGARVQRPLGDAAALAQKIKAADWNEYRVLARGSVVSHYVNGALLAECDDRRNAAPRSGGFALQLHGGAPMQVWFKDLWLRRLDPVTKPQWIWSADNRFEASLGGEKVLSGDDWQRPASADVTKFIRSGNNDLSIRATNEGGPCGVAVELDIEWQVGGRTLVCSGPDWFAQVAGAQAAPVRVLGPMGMAPWGDVFAPPLATPAAKLKVKPGYRAELLRSADYGEGSWIAMAFDQKGRLHLSRERGGIIRVHGTGTDLRLEDLKLPPAINNAHGLLFAFDALWVNVNGHANGGLYRLRDVDGDDQFEDVQRVLTWDGEGEHGAHSVIAGPDGNLWIINGNFSALPVPLAANSPHRNFKEDVLLQRIPDPGGHDPHIWVPGSYVLRYSPQGGEPALYAAGLRNACDLAFDRHGELYTFDSDMEWDVGSPWYRPVRINKITSGAEFGWRNGSGKWPAYAFDSLPAVVDVGRGSPTGVTFLAGAAVAPSDQIALAAADWSMGRIVLVHTEGQPPSFENLVSGKPLNVTDVVVGPDRAIWFTTGGRRTQSGLYRLSWDGAAPAAAAGSIPEAVYLRRRLEAFHGVVDAKALEGVWPHLGAADREVRTAARVALEWQPSLTWRERALRETEPASALTALVALARVGDAGDRQAVLDRCAELAQPELAPARQFELLRTCAVALSRHGELDAPRRTRLVTAIAGLRAGSERLLQRERAEVLVALRADGLVAPLLASLAAAATQHEQLDWGYLLAHVADGWDAASLATYAQWLHGARAQFGGGNSFRGFLDGMGKLLSQGVADKDLAAKFAELQKPRPSTANASLAVEPGPFVRAWVAQDLIGHLDQVAEGRSFKAGERAYRAAQCITCHKMGEQGGTLGPELTTVSRRFNRRDLLDSILEPSKAVSDQYQMVVLSLRDGSTLVGRIQREDAREVVVVTDLLAGTTKTLAPGDIAARVASPVSSMPAGLINTLTREQILDLLAYLENEADAGADAFK
jgi:putative heme-binding domain-containing protein